MHWAHISADKLVLYKVSGENSSKIAEIAVTDNDVITVQDGFIIVNNRTQGYISPMINSTCAVE